MAKFCVFGDSIAKGVTYDTIKQKYVLVKESCANIFADATGFVVRNYARFGSTVHKGLEMLGKHKQEIPQYNHTVLEFGGNDCDFKWSEVAAAPDAIHLPNTELHVFEKEYGNLVDEIKSDGGNPVLLTLPPLHAPRFFDWVSKDLDKEAILHWLGGDAYFTYRWQELYSLAVCRLAIEKDVPLIDIRQAFLQKINYENYLCEDGMHPTEAGHQLISEVLCDSWNKASA